VLRLTRGSVNAYDIVVVGGGIGGASLAATMAGAGRRVLVLEQTRVFEDEVRGEWIAPWGVAEAKRLGLYDLLIGAGGHHVHHHVTYDETLDPAMAREAILPLDTFAPGVPGPLCLGHPKHRQALFDEAGRRGATMLRGVDVDSVFTGAEPSVIYTVDGERCEARARLLIGADGRNSIVRDACAIRLHADTPHHMFGGLLVQGVKGWDESEQATGTADGFGFIAFPQGGGKVRVYGAFSLHDRARFIGTEGPRHFLDSVRMPCSPNGARIAEGEPAGPLRAYLNSDAWTDEPYARGAVLVGDAAGWNDPLIGLGLSITYRDVRIVSDLLKTSDDWSPELFEPYAEERRERMRRLRFVARLTASLDAEFGDKARARRQSYFKRAAADPMLASWVCAVMAGPETAAPEVFTAAHRALVLGETRDA
jgi:2-polyprenyl-6-methoxyphenol hydroxylase-like FAD-dependent oxidoreductase